MIIHCHIVTPTTCKHDMLDAIARLDIDRSTPETSFRVELRSDEVRSLRQKQNTCLGLLCYYKLSSVSPLEVIEQKITKEAKQYSHNILDQNSEVEAIFITFGKRTRSRLNAELGFTIGLILFSARYL